MKPKAVICDDEPHIRVMLKALLKSMGVDVAAEGKNGDDAVELYRREKPHLLLLDINMPGKSGEEALNRIIGEFPSALVVMMTSVADLETVKRCLETGAANYILKETPVQEIKQILKETWAERYSQRESRDA